MTRIKILVRSTLGKNMVLDVESSDTIADVKEKIYEHDGTPPERQRLAYDGRELRHDHRTVSDYGIDDDFPEIELVRRRPAPIQIVITTVNGWDRVTTLDDVEVTDTVRSIKARIRDKLGVRVDRQTLYFEYTLMEDPRIIAEYGIVRNHDTLDLRID